MAPGVTLSTIEELVTPPSPKGRSLVHEGWVVEINVRKSVLLGPVVLGVPPFGLVAPLWQQMEATHEVARIEVGHLQEPRALTDYGGRDWRLAGRLAVTRTGSGASWRAAGGGDAAAARCPTSARPGRSARRSA